MEKNKKYQVTFEIEADDISYVNFAVINSTTSEIFDTKLKDIIEIQ